MRSKRSEAKRLPGLVRELVRELVHEKLSDPVLSPDYLAAVLGVSRRHLYAACDAELGPIATHIRGQRLEHSRALLETAERDMPVAEIALASGFTDSAHFARLFRNLYGLPPARCRAQHADL